jgi:hypothetical protein
VSETIRLGTVKTRKPHHCWGCTIEIPAGTLVVSQTFEDIGQVTTAYFCDICSEIQSEDNEGCCYGDWQEEAEARRAATHPQPGESAGEKEGA